MFNARTPDKRRPMKGEIPMSAVTVSRPANDDTHIGEYAAAQPISGVTYVNASTAVSGLGRGGCVPREDAEKDKAAS